MTVVSVPEGMGWRQEVDALVEENETLIKKLEQSEAGLLVTFGQLKASREIVQEKNEIIAAQQKRIIQLENPPPQGPPVTYEREDGR